MPSMSIRYSLSVTGTLAAFSSEKKRMNMGRSLRGPRLRPMFMRFFSELKAAKVPVTLKEYLMLMEGMDKSVIDRRVEDFYYLSRAILVKDEKYLDRFDVVFGHVFKGLDLLQIEQIKDIPTEWLDRKST